MRSTPTDQESPLLGGGKDPQVFPPQPTESPTDDRRFRDKAFLVFFLLNLALVVYVAAVYGYGALSYRGDSSKNNVRSSSTELVVGCLCGLGAVATAFSGLWVGYMMKKANKLILCTLWATVVLYLLGAALGIAIQEYILVASSALMALVSLCYLRSAKPYVPFASAQLTAGVAAVRESLVSVMLVAYISLAVSVACSAVWSLAIYGLMDHYHRTDEDSSSSHPVAVRGLVYFLLVVSFIWAQKVVAGVVTVTVSGVVGSWWFNPSQLQPSPVRGSLVRALTTSLGSICLGSLLVSLIEAARAMVEQARQRRQEGAAAQENRGGGNCLLCLADCVLSVLDSLATVFSRWAYCYVGLYGYSFRESGRRVMQLFKRRGLTAVLDDSLIERVLLLGSVVVGLLTCGLGLVAYALLWPPQQQPEDGDSTIKVVLGVGGLMVGYLVCDVMMSTISSSVSTIYVCFIEDAGALQNNHPDYYEYLHVAWQARFPTTVF